MSRGVVDWGISEMSGVGNRFFWIVGGVQGDEPNTKQGSDFFTVLRFKKGFVSGFFSVFSEFNLKTLSSEGLG